VDNRAAVPVPTGLAVTASAGPMAPGATGDTLPSSFGDAVREQIALTLQPPYETLITVAVNGALMSSAWFLLPTDVKNKVFTLHGTLAFALVLAAWMYSDVPATNVLGPDPSRVSAALDDPRLFRRLLYAKNVVLWLIVTPVCAVVALIVGLRTMTSCPPSTPSCGSAWCPSASSVSRRGWASFSPTTRCRCATAGSTGCPDGACWRAGGSWC
jgi:hypothetical protein